MFNSPYQTSLQHLSLSFRCVCQTVGKVKQAVASDGRPCQDDFADAYKQCESTVATLQSQLTSLNRSMVQLTQQVSRCSAIHDEVFFQQYIRSLLQHLSKLADHVSGY